MICLPISQVFGQYTGEYGGNKIVKVAIIDTA